MRFVYYVYLFYDFVGATLVFGLMNCVLLVFCLVWIGLGLRRWLWGWYKTGFGDFDEFCCFEFIVRCLLLVWISVFMVILGFVVLLSFGYSLLAFLFCGILLWLYVCLRLVLLIVLFNCLFYGIYG